MPDVFDSDAPRRIRCRRCPRLFALRRRLQRSHPDYWNAPVSPAGPIDGRLLIVGLAPGLHGANRTGIPFTGDASGDWLHRMLDRYALWPTTRITNAVKCLPPDNQPLGSEVVQCRPYLRRELDELVSAARTAVNGVTPIVLALGGVAHRAVIGTRGLRQADFVFGHGAEHWLPDGLLLLDSYHCSRYNQNTGRLTEAMFDSVFSHAATCLARVADS